MSSLISRWSSLDANPNVFLYPVTSQINITSHGSYVYWAIMVVMISFTTGFFSVSLRSSIVRTERLFYYLAATITLMASISYFAMASNLGYAAIQVEFMRNRDDVSGEFREIFYVRYIEWVVTTPLFLIILLKSAGVPWTLTLFTIALDEIMIVSGLVGALVTSTYKWGFFVFGMAALVAVAISVLYTARQYALGLQGGPNDSISRAYMPCAIVSMFLWTLYPITWGLCEGGNVAPPDTEAAIYGVLDVLTKPVFLTFLLWQHSKLNLRSLGVNHRDYNDTIEIKDFIKPNASTTINRNSGNIGNSQPSEVSVMGR